MVECLSKFHGRGIKIVRVNSIPVAKPSVFFHILRAISPQLTSSWAMVFFELNVRIPYIVYKSWVSLQEPRGWHQDMLDKE